MTEFISEVYSGYSTSQINSDLFMYSNMLQLKLRAWEVKTCTSKMTNPNNLVWPLP